MRARSCFALRLVGARRLDLRVERRALAGRLAHRRLRLPAVFLVPGGGARSREIGLGLRQLHAILLRIDLNEERVLLHVLVVARVHELDVAADLREDRYEVAVDGGVVRRLVGAAVAPLLISPDEP